MQSQWAATFAWSKNRRDQGWLCCLKRISRSEPPGSTSTRRPCFPHGWSESCTAICKAGTSISTQTSRAPNGGVKFPATGRNCSSGTGRSSRHTERAPLWNSWPGNIACRCIPSTRSFITNNSPGPRQSGPGFFLASWVGYPSVRCRFFRRTGGWTVVGWRKGTIERERRRYVYSIRLSRPRPDHRIQF